MAQTIVGIREFRARLGHYLRQVKNGTTLVITERGKTIGRIIPESLSAEARVHELVAAGFVDWNGKKLAPIKPVARVRGSRTVADLVIENRE